MNSFFITHYNSVCFFVVLFCGLAEAEMNYNPMTKLNSFKQKMGYDHAINNERQDGLILIDFRKIAPPPFATQWPVIDYEWGFHEGVSEESGKRVYSFRWLMAGENLKAVIEVGVCGDYEDARRTFLNSATDTTGPTSWEACKKKIGTVCARGYLLFFVYKNVFIEIASNSLMPDGEDFIEVLAEWLFNVLKKHPLTPMLPPGPLTLAKPSGSVSKKGYWKTFIPPELAPKEAPRLNANGPLYKYQGDKLNALGFEGPPVWDNLVWIWIGENYPDQQAVFQAGGIAVERYDRERRNPPE